LCDQRNLKLLRHMQIRHGMAWHGWYLAEVRPRIVESSGNACGDDVYLVYKCMMKCIVKAYYVHGLIISGCLLILTYDFLSDVLRTKLFSQNSPSFLKSLFLQVFLFQNYSENRYPSLVLSLPSDLLLPILPH
jgi:hypothetical protein